MGAFAAILQLLAQNWASAPLCLAILFAFAGIVSVNKLSWIELARRIANPRNAPRFTLLLHLLSDAERASSYHLDDMLEALSKLMALMRKRSFNNAVEEPRVFSISLAKTMWRFWEADHAEWLQELDRKCATSLTSPGLRPFG